MCVVVFTLTLSIICMIQIKDGQNPWQDQRFTFKDQCFVFSALTRVLLCHQRQALETWCTSILDNMPWLKKNYFWYHHLLHEYMKANSLFHWNVDILIHFCPECNIMNQISQMILFTCYFLAQQLQQYVLSEHVDKDG